MIILPIKLALISFFTIPVSIAVQTAPLFKFILEFIFLTLHITRMILSVSFIWLWEIAFNIAFIDFLAIILSVYISTKVLLDFFSYEIVFTFNSEQFEQQIDLN
ncbi:hypothetical protein CAEBREN_18156 [Caenorhabditis brenneri]|uniref:Uncharacterized protein n=1 Tax=Caenorhabditis brenneri TaxID=135651 RepID=G0PIJ0_CAEBE|nr:hypothetical protein CAEBREN_18156 [Caenorhabditis brenneri]